MIILGQQGQAQEFARINGNGTLVVIADTSQEATGRCIGDQVPFTSYVLEDSLDSGSSRFSEAFGIPPDIPSFPITIRRGTVVDREGDDEISARFSQGFRQNTPLEDPDYQISLHVEVVGCARLGGLRVTDIVVAVDGVVTQFQMTHQISLLNAERTGSFMSYRQETPRTNSSQDGHVVFGDSFEVLFDMPYQSEHLGVMAISASNRGASFQAVDGTDIAIEGAITFELRLALMDGGLSGF